MLSMERNDLVIGLYSLYSIDNATRQQLTTTTNGGKAGTNASYQISGLHKIK
jgi:hypothetical protein